MEIYQHASQKTAAVLASKVGTDGKLNDDAVSGDLGSLYKFPTLFFLSGHTMEAHRLLNYIKSHFMQTNGDFISYPQNLGRDRKSSSFAMQHFWTYMNAWIAMGAHRLGRFDISVPAYNFCKTFYNPDLQAVCVTEAFSEIVDESTVDCLSTAHFGLLCLYMGDVSMATKCGEGLLGFLSVQPDLQQRFFLRRSAKTGSLITISPPEMELFYVVKKEEPKQLYFFVGYYIIFMAKLHLATKDQRFLDGAKAVLEFTLQCHESLYCSTFSHKVAYAAALVAVETKESKYKNLATKIGEYLVSVQNTQGFFCDDTEAVNMYDQSAEIAIWLQELTNELERM